MSAHSRFGGSVCKRWLNCAGSVALCDTVPQDRSSRYAAEGTAAHDLAARSLTESLHPTHWLGETISADGFDFEVTQEMCDAVVVYLNAVTHEAAQTKTAELYVEQGFVLDVETAEKGEVFGTNDAMVYHPATGRLRVFDYKHGVGVNVDVEDNDQLKFYAAGAVFSNAEWRIKDVVLTIVQPRARDNDTEADAIRDWTFTVAELLDFVVQVEVAISRAKSEAQLFAHDVVLTAASYTTRHDAKSGSLIDEYPAFNIGDWCRWCPAAAICPARERQALEAATLDFADITLVDTTDLPDPRDMDTERLSRVVAGLSLVSRWMAQCQERLEALVLAGVEVPGWKAVEKIGRAKWIEDPLKVAAEAQLAFGLDEDQVMPRKLVTITECEKLLKSAGATKDQVDTFKLRYTTKDSSGLTIAPITDRRPAINPLADYDGVHVT